MYGFFTNVFIKDAPLSFSLAHGDVPQKKEVATGNKWKEEKDQQNEEERIESFTRPEKTLVFDMELYPQRSSSDGSDEEEPQTKKNSARHSLPVTIPSSAPTNNQVSGASDTNHYRTYS